MKRVYVVLILMFFLFLSAGVLLGQQDSRPIDNQEDGMEKRLRMRQEMHRRMMDKLLRGTGPDQDMFKDMEEFLNDVMTDSFTGFDSFTKPSRENFSMLWSDTQGGKTLVITPKSPEQQLDIDVSNGFITIKGKVEERGNHSVSVSTFNNSVSVPQSCDSSKVRIEQKNGKILISFPCEDGHSSSTIPKKKLKPIPPSDTDVDI